MLKTLNLTIFYAAICPALRLCVKFREKSLSTYCESKFEIGYDQLGPSGARAGSPDEGI